MVSKHDNEKNQTVRSTVEFSVPGKPVGKQRPRYSRRNQCFYTPPKTREYERFVAAVARKAGLKPTTNNVGIVITWVNPGQKDEHLEVTIDQNLEETQKHATDLDNIIKTICDALQGIAYYNDRQVNYIGATIEKR